MNKHVLSLIVLVFVLGWICNNVYSEVYKDFSSYTYKFKNLNKNITENPLANVEVSLKERDSPYDRIKESQIHVYQDSVVIDLDNPEWSRFTDTNSMDPVIDKGANAIHIIPQSEEDIHIGDIVAYKSKYADGTIIHRVIETGRDEDGKYFILKGDNNPRPDPGRVRFSQIERVLVAIIY